MYKERFKRLLEKFENKNIDESTKEDIDKKENNDKNISSIIDSPAFIHLIILAIIILLLL